MRTISAGLLAAQGVRSARARAEVAFETRGTAPGLPMVAWEQVVGNGSQTVYRSAALVARSDGAVLWYKITPTALQVAVVADPTNPTDWSGASFSTIVATGGLAVAALRANVLRVWYVNASNNVLYVEATDATGTVFGAAVTVYSGGDATGDLVVADINDGVTSNGRWFFGFSTYDGGTGLYTARFGYYDGSSWVTHAYSSGWQAAGIDAYAGASAATPGRHRVLVMRQWGEGPSRVRALDKLGSAYSNAQDVDQTQGGLFGLELNGARYCQMDGYMAGVVQEGAVSGGHYMGVASVWTQDADVVADEGVILDGLRTTRGAKLPALVEAASGDLYLAGDVAVWRGVRMAAPAGTFAVQRYEYADQTLRLELGALEAAGVSPGMVAVLTRTLSWGSDSGSEVVRAVVMRVERGTARTVIVARDALGLLGSLHCRRPAVLNDGNAAGAAQVMRRLAARMGLRVAVDNAALETAAVMPFTAMPGENLRGASFRVGSQADWYLVPANDGSVGLTMITPGTSDSGDYAAAAQAYGTGQVPVDEAAELAEFRRLAFSYVLGTKSTDPEDGAAVAMAAGVVEPGTRPLSYSLTNMRYNTTARVDAAAATEAARLSTLPEVARLTTTANLAVELYDVVEVTEARMGWTARTFRVRAIDEVYDRGRLRQTLTLGEV